ncbi:MAG TPA: hypothetical protein VNX68_16110, partial [Nitrosopumilaceae archaeon]|nr:hypothetical protein [Nitrosopumilaceae archaeon]
NEAATESTVAIEKVAIHRGRWRGVSDKILAYKEKHPEATYAEIAKALKSGAGYVRKVLTKS